MAKIASVYFIDDTDRPRIMDVSIADILANGGVHRVPSASECSPGIQTHAWVAGASYYADNSAVWLMDYMCRNSSDTNRGIAT